MSRRRPAGERFDRIPDDVDDVLVQAGATVESLLVQYAAPAEPRGPVLDVEGAPERRSPTAHLNAAEVLARRAERFELLMRRGEG